MQFVFQTVPCVHMEWGASKHIAKICSDKFNEKNILIVTDAGIRKAGILQSAIQSLEDNKFNVHIFDGVSADPSETVLLECVDFAKKAEIDCVLGVGGGSSLDVAKLVAVLLKGDQELSGIYGIGNVKGNRTPLVLVPTTAGTGSEVTNISIITTGATTKMGVVAHQLYADIVILDAQLTIGLPKIHTAATGIDAMVHAIEAYTSRHKKNPLSDALAREALRLLCGSLIKACRDGEDQSARENMLLGATLAGQAFANSPVGAVHALAYPLGGHYHVPHGISNALMLEPVLRFNFDHAYRLYAELGEAVGLEKKQDIREQATDFIEFIVSLLERSGAPRCLRDVHVAEDMLPVLAKDAMKQTRLLQNNPIDVSENDALKLYEQVF